jgi:hypothetical protein
MTVEGGAADTRRVSAVPFFLWQCGLIRKASCPLIAEIHRADWTIHFPKDFDVEGILDVFQPLTHVEHELEAFPWHLTGRLVGLLEKPQSIFEYYQVTSFFRARAAMLALRGDVLYKKHWHAALVQHQVQVGGIYREHLLYFLRAFLKKHNFGELPECEVDALDLLRDPVRTAANRDLILRVVQWAESNYVNTLNFISLASSLEDEYRRHTLRYWVKGGGKPRGKDLQVLIRRHETGHDVLPSPNDAKTTLRAGRDVTKSVVKVSAEGRGLGVGTTEGTERLTVDSRRGKTVDGTQTADRSGDVKPPLHVDPRREKAGTIAGGVARPVGVPTAGPSAGVRQGPAVELKSGVQVIGDYKVIRIPGHADIKLARKHKARAVLGFIHRRLKALGTNEFYDEEMRDEFNAQFRDGHVGNQWKSDRFRDDLFRGMDAEFDLLFETLDSVSGQYRLKLLGWLVILGLWGFPDGGIGLIWDVGLVA